MLTTLIARIVYQSARHAWPVVAVFGVLILASAIYVARNFAINTDVGQLIEANTPWARRDAAIAAAFPDRGESTLVVVRAPAPEFAAQAARELAGRLRGQPRLFQSVSLGAGDDFFRRNGLLYLNTHQVQELTGRLLDARPLLNALAADPSLRGLANLLSVSLLTPLQTGQLTLAGMKPLLAGSANTMEAVLAGRPAALSWQALVDPDAGAAPSLIEVRPVLDYSELLPGAPSSGAIRAAAADLHLAQRYGAGVKLTGPVPLSDDEFASLQEGSPLTGAIPVLIVLVLLWRALRSTRLVLALCLTMLGGLVLTAALGVLVVGAFNLISVAFAILFVGLAIDFGIQFGLRYRTMRSRRASTRQGLLATARSIALPLTLAAVATACGFLVFLPTDYRGVAELGEIAGLGILVVALPACLTVFPALIQAIDPPRTSATPGYRWLCPADRVLQRHRDAVLAATLALVAAGIPLLWHLDFDFNPLHLKNPHSESMVALTLLAASGNGSNADVLGIDNVQVLAPSLAAAEALAHRLEALPEVSNAMNASDMVPDDQPAKLDAIARAAAGLLPVLGQAPRAAASDLQRVASLRAAAQALRNAALDHPGPGAQEAERLAKGLNALARADAATRTRAERAFAEPLRLVLATLALALQPVPVTPSSLPAELRRHWIAPDGRALIDVSPRRFASTINGAPEDDGTLLERFSEAVQRIAPDAAGGPISVHHAAELIIRAFIEAALLAILTIALLLWISFRRIGDVLLTMVPLLVSSMITLEACVLLGISLNFANIIALPLLLGVGVAFKIYYVVAWRNGQEVLLSHPLTQAVVLSAASTGIAFGSLWLSNHPGTASMGRLLVLSLVCMLIGAVFFQPILLGKPRPRRARP
jgi:hopanoid biosynthesis associated RND transporter like protein HpnN